MQAMRESQKFFLQSFMSRGILNTKEVKNLYSLACRRYGEDEQDPGLAQFVVSINHCIKPFGLDIKKGIGEDRGDSFYILVNANDSELTLKATDFASHELEFFKKLVENIVTSEEGSIRSIEAINLSSNVKERKMKKEEAEQILARLEDESWIEVVQGIISLSARSILELEPYFNSYLSEHVVKCDMCKKTCIKGQKCNVCDVKLHLHCAAKYFEKQTDPKCPSSRCRSAWPHQIFRKGNKDGLTQYTAVQNESMDESEMNGDKLETPEPSTSRASTRKRRR